MVNHNLLAKIMLIHMNQPDVPCDTCTEEKQASLESYESYELSLNKNKITYILKQPEIENIKNENIKIKDTNKSEIKTKEKSRMNPEKNCWCYNKESQDMRCCGLCYTFCYLTNKEDQCYVCPETFEIFYTSGYFVTTCGYGHTGDDCEDCVPTTLCLPLKLPIFFPCLLGSLFNNVINYCRYTDSNYLC